MIEAPKPMIEIVYRFPIKGSNGSREIYKIKIEDHTYIYFRNTWNAAGDAFLHDPSCKCLNSKGKND